jgi:hypothetical protein
MPATSTLQPDRYHRGDTGDFRQVDSSGNDNAVLGWAGGVVYRTVAAGTALTASDTETLLGSFSIPADTLVAGSVIKLRYQGIVTASNSTDTLTVKVYIGGLAGTAILTGTATDAANSDIFEGEALIQIRTAGESGTFVAVGSHVDVPEASGTAVRVVESLGSTAIDTTAAQVVGVAGTWSTTNAGNSCRLDIMVVEIY